MAAWRVEFYESAEAGCPVREFLTGLEKEKRAKIVALIRLLEEKGATLPFPYSSQVRGKLRELRAHYGKAQYRVLYFGAPNRVFVLLRAFVKTTKATPQQEIELAEQYRAAYVETLKQEGSR